MQASRQAEELGNDKITVEERPVWVRDLAAELVAAPIDR
jgi:hypothetical protein